MLIFTIFAKKKRNIVIYMTINTTSRIKGADTYI